MTTAQLIFIGIKGSVVALNRATGQQVWATRLKGSDFVNVVLEDGTVLASCYGEIFCLDPLTGIMMWHNPLKGFGLGLATIATERNPGCGNAAVLAEKRRRCFIGSLRLAYPRCRPKRISLSLALALCRVTVIDHVRAAKRQRILSGLGRH